MARPQAPSFTIGIEEEYLLVDQKTLDLIPAPEGLMKACADKLGDQVSPEFLQCQIEVGTGVCETIAEAREDLTGLRRTVAEVADGFGASPIAVSTHPFARWQRQEFTDRERYRALEKDLAGVARRMLIGGMHVHVGIEDEDLRMDLMGQFTYFLPHLLALSTSSPFWEGEETGLKSYRLTVFDNLPRTGLPPLFAGFHEYKRSVQALIDTEVIEDPTKIWWDLRPSDRFPTVEARICDVSPRIEDTLAIAALIQSLYRFLWTLRVQNTRRRTYDRFLIEENRWRALRYGTEKGLIDFGRREIVPFPELIDEIIEMVTPHAKELKCLPEVQRLASVSRDGTSADRQSRTYHEAVQQGADSKDALREVVKQLIEEFSAA